MGKGGKTLHFPECHYLLNLFLISQGVQNKRKKNTINKKDASHLIHSMVNHIIQMHTYTLFTFRWMLSL